MGSVRAPPLLGGGPRRVAAGLRHWVCMVSELVCANPPGSTWVLDHGLRCGVLSDSLEAETGLRFSPIRSPAGPGLAPPSLPIPSAAPHTYLSGGALLMG